MLTTTERGFGSQAWMGRAVFEVALILIGILGAFAVTEWRDTRDRQARVDAVMSAVRAELRSNLKVLEEASTYNTTVADRFKELRTKNVEEAPSSTHPRGLMIIPPLSSAAWDAAREGGVLNDVPVQTILVLGRAYEAQRVFLASSASLIEDYYAAALVTKVPLSPAPLAGILGDFASRGRGLITHYRETFEQLDRAD